MVQQRFPEWNDRHGILLGSIGLVVTWLLFLAAYGVTCRLSALFARAPPGANIARAFAPTLVPVAVAYNIAHNLGYVIVQGQGVIPLVSDPLGRGWNLFGTAAYAPEIGIVDARLAWQIAIGAIVDGHVIAVWLAHRVALSMSVGARRATVNVDSAHRSDDRVHRRKSPGGRRAAGAFRCQPQ
ncbi:MAG: hypothetical protein ABJB78_01835 [Betaproteobacteria bacterium]